MGHNSTRLCAKHDTVRNKQKWSTNTSGNQLVTEKAFEAMVDHTRNINWWWHMLQKG